MNRNNFYSYSGTDHFLIGLCDFKIGRSERLQALSGGEDGMSKKLSLFLIGLLR